VKHNLWSDYLRNELRNPRIPPTSLPERKSAYVKINNGTIGYIKGDFEPMVSYQEFFVTDLISKNRTKILAKKY